MSDGAPQQWRVAIACGGTGGHLFPGLAVAHELRRRQCSVALLISTKEVDRTAVEGLDGFEVLALPAVGLANGRLLHFARGFYRSYGAVKENFQALRPQAVLAMGGFTSAPPLLAARRCGARCFLHESNTIPGRANRWLSWIVERAFVGFPEAARRLHTSQVIVTGTPVRLAFQPRDPAPCRWALGLDPARPVVLVMGGSQGANGINRLVIETLPLAARAAPEMQWIHLSGSFDFDLVKQAYEGLGLRAAVFPFFREMEVALGAASVALSRAGASSLAELAAMRLPPLLVPFPEATDDHQTHNARAFQESGAAYVLPQVEATPEKLLRHLLDLLGNESALAAMRRAMAAWHRPQSAEQIVGIMLESLQARSAPLGKDPRGARAEAGKANGLTLDRTRSGLAPAAAIGAKSQGQEVPA